MSGPCLTTLALRDVPFDHPDVAALTDRVQLYYEELYGGPDTTPVDPAEFTPPEGRFFVGYADGVPVAMGGWRFYRRPVESGGSSPAEIKRMYVVPEARGRGYARTVLAHLEHTARAAGADALVLETGRPQQDAIGLYRRHGYFDIPGFGYYCGEEGSVHLAKRLEPNG